MNPYRHVQGVMLLVTTLLAASLPAQAATFNVDKTADDAAATACDDATPNDCSLRGAILAANALSEASIINVPAGTFVLSQSSTCTFRVTTSSPGIFTSAQIPLCLSADITIQGAGATDTIIDGDRRGRVLFVSADAVAELRGVTIENGTGGPSFFSSQGGGGIQNHGTLTLTDSVVSNNTLPASTSNGAGIENFGTLSLRRSTVTNNVSVLGSEGGGGIHNEGFYSASVLIVSESTISNNAAGSRGGGISNGATATIINSTISDNTAKNGFGGGIANLHAGGFFAARLTVINSTISGNSSGSLGGGLYNGGLTAADLNNVTITDNTADTSLFSRGGGGINNQASSEQFTLQNTIIAGNRDLGSVPAPDCFAEAGNGLPVTSRGYNLIQDATHCTILGDTTGTLTGVDPQLGPLLDNGGLTKTHALGAGSPAVDGGNPGAPGSGGTACTASDERGFSRLQDGDEDGVGRCDIGAYELAESAVGFSFSGLRPNAAGNGDSAYALIYGSGFVSGMTVRLVRAGEPDIVGSPVTVEPGGAVAATSFALAGQSAGLWDVVVANPDGDSRTLTGAFTIEPGGGPQIWSEVVGLPVIRVGRPARFALFVGNRGNVDARAVPVRIAVQQGVDVGLSFPPLSAPPFQTGQVRTVWSQTPLGVPTEDGTTNILLLLPLVPAGFTTTLELTLTAAASAVGRQLVLRAPADPPLFAPDLDPQLVADQVAGARVYAEDAIGIPIPPELAPDLERYLRTQLANLVENGRNALLASVGAQSQVYSRAQLVVDLARFGAVLAGAQPPPPIALGTRTGTHGSIRVAANRQQGVVDRISTSVVSLVIPAAAYGAGGGVLDEGQSQSVGCDGHGGSPQGCIKSNNEVLGVTCCPKGMTSAQCCGGSGGWPFTNVLGKDPNDKTGPRGAGDARFIVGADALRYVIAFENIETASAAAQEVIITDQLDATKVDLDTFSLGPIAFGDHHVTPPPGLSQYSTSVDLRPAVDLLVAIDARLDKSTGLVTWHFLSIDPLTGQFTEDPVAGFLPPDVTPPEGDGSVAFTIQPRRTDAPICNQASIVFDVNEAILTPDWCNSFDDTPPSSAVLALAPTQSSPGFTVAWSGTDTGSGIADYTIFVSENGGPFTPFVSDTTDTSATFTGQTGNAYAFYSIARDAVGHVEAAPAIADAETVVGEPADLATDTPTPEATSTLTTTPTGTATEAPTPTHSPTGTSTSTPTASATITRSATPTHSPTNTRPPTQTHSPTPQPTATASPTPPPGCGDIDGDGRVTARDVVAEVLALAFHRHDARFDINGDGRITVADLVLVVHQLGESCPPTAQSSRLHRSKRPPQQLLPAGRRDPAPAT